MGNTGAIGEMVRKQLSEISWTGRVKRYPDGSAEYMACTKHIFREAGWELPDRAVDRPGKPLSINVDIPEELLSTFVDSDPGETVENSVDNSHRAERRARARVRDIALCTDFAYFVTLTLDRAKVDRYDMGAITRKLNAWLSNQVQRRGLAYVLVPERHEDGAIHFHGFFNRALEAVDSGTIIPPGGGRPRKPKSERQRAVWTQQGGRIVYNLPGWSLGFTTAIELWGDYHSAVSYVCKYIGKQGEKPGGRWYYSGGAVGHPEVQLVELDWRELAAEPGAYTFSVPEAAAQFVIWREPPKKGRADSAGPESI